MPDPSLAVLLRELGDGTRELIKKEILLARAEISASVDQGKRAIVWLVIALVPAIMALVALPMALMWGLDTVMPRWAAALVTGGAMLLIAGLAAYIGIVQLRRAKPVPEQTIETVREDVEWMRNRLS